MPSGRRSNSRPSVSLTSAQKTSFDSFFSTVDSSLWNAQNIKTFFRKFNFRIPDKALTSHAIALTKKQLTILHKEDADKSAKDEQTRKERALREMLTGLQRKRRNPIPDFQTPPKRGIRGPKHSPIRTPIFNLCTGGSQTNNISFNAEESILNTNTLEEEDTPAIDPASPASGSDHSNASSQDTFSAHFRKMHGKLLLRNKRYLEDLVYSALEKETVCGEKELWLLESSIINFDYLTWLDLPTQTELRKFKPRSPPTLQAITECEAYLKLFWESTNFEDDMPPLVSKTPWNKPEDYNFYNYYHRFLHYWYNFIPIIGVDPCRGSESWLSARVYNLLFQIFQAPSVSLRHGETASVHLPNYRFDGIFAWNNIEFGAIEIAPEGAQSSHQAKVDKDCYKLYQVVGKIYNKLNEVARSKVPHPAVGIMCRGFSFTVIKVSHLSENLLQTSHHEFLLPTTLNNISDLKDVLHSIGILYNMLNKNRQFVQNQLRLNNTL